MLSSASSCSALSANQRRPTAHLETSPLAAAKVLPISVVRMRATSGTSPSRSSAAVIRWRDRSAKVVVRYSANAALARCSSRSSSSGVRAGNSFSVFPVAGLIVAKGMGPVLPGRRQPQVIGHGAVV